MDGSPNIDDSRDVRAENSAANAPLVAPGTAIDFWERIRQHKVAQWGLAYLGAAVAVAHGQELVAHAFHWPEIVGRLVIGAMVLGFPIVLTVAWYHGHQGLKRLTAGEMSIIALLILIGAGLLFFLVRPSDHPGETALAPSSVPAAPAVLQANSIAVLPFENMSGDASQAYFCDGISEEIRNALARVPGIQVIGRTSSFSFKGKGTDLRSIGRMLGVATLVEGSVRRQGDQVRISAQLVRASDGIELWSQTFDRGMSDVLKLQEEIAEAIASNVGGGAGGASKPASTTNGLAYDRYLEGMALVYKGDYDGLERGITKLEQAVVLDPNLAPAWAALANNYGFQFLYDKRLSLAQARARVTAAQKRALDLDPQSALALLARAGTLEMSDDWAEFDTMVHRALRLNPNDSGVIGTYTAFAFSTGRIRDAIPAIKRGYELDPLSSFHAASYGYALYIAGGRRAEGRALLDEAVALIPKSFYARLLRQLVLLSEGNIAAAAADQRFLLEHAAFDDQERAFGERVLALALAGDRKKLREVLAQGAEQFAAGKLHIDWFTLDGWAMVAGDARLAAASWLAEDSLPDNRFSFIWRWAPVLAAARAQPDFKKVVERHKLPAYWRSHGWPDFCRPIAASDFECH